MKNGKSFNPNDIEMIESADLDFFDPNDIVLFDPKT